MDINPKNYSRGKRWKKHASRRDYRYGGKIGGRSVKRVDRAFTCGNTYDQICEETVEVSSWSDQDSRLKKAGVKLPLEQKLGFSLPDANKANFSKMEQLKEALEDISTTVTPTTLEANKGFGQYGRHTVKKTWYSMPSQNLDTNGTVAHMQQKKESEVRKMLREFGIEAKQQHVAHRVRLTRFLPHGEVANDSVPCVADPKTGKRMGLHVIQFRAPMKTTVKVGFRTFDSKVPEDEYTEIGVSDGPRTRSHFRGPKNGKNEIAHDLDISNCQSLKIETRHLTTWVGSLCEIPLPQGRYSRPRCCFEVFVYGTPEKTEEDLEDEVPVGSGVIKNSHEVAGKVTVVCLQEAETVNDNWHTYTKGRWCWDRDEKSAKIHTDEDFVIRGEEYG